MNDTKAFLHQTPVLLPHQQQAYIFTDKIFSQLKSKNIEILYVTLHIGLGTFNPITKENIIDHKMHKENYSITSKIYSSEN